MEVSAAPPSGDAISELGGKFGATTCDMPAAVAGLTAAGHPQLIPLLAATESGAVLYYKLQAGSVPAADVAAWVLEELKASAIMTWVQANFQSAVLRERHAGHMRYEVPHSSMSLAAMFGLLERNRAPLDIASYALSQTSLEQIFNRFAARQEEEVGWALSCLCVRALASRM